MTNSPDTRPAWITDDSFVAYASSHNTTPEALYNSVIDPNEPIILDPELSEILDSITWTLSATRVSKP